MAPMAQHSVRRPGTSSQRQQTRILPTPGPGTPPKAAVTGTCALLQVLSLSVARFKVFAAVNTARTGSGTRLAQPCEKKKKKKMKYIITYYLF